MKTFKEVNSPDNINESVDEIIQIANALNVSLDMARIIITLAGVTGVATLSILLDKMETILSKKNPALSKKLAEIAAGSAAGRK